MEEYLEEVKKTRHWLWPETEIPWAPSRFKYAKLTQLRLDN